MLAFTLAETLIVMGVIGIVAALTIPNLNSSTNNMEKVAKVKKTYAQLVEAQDRATAIYGPIETWFKKTDGVGAEQVHTGAKRYLERMEEFLKVQKTCMYPTSSACTVNASVKSLNNGTAENYYNSRPQAILADGVTLDKIYISNWSCQDQLSPYKTLKIKCGYIDFDIDGANKGKNTWGVDIFRVAITKEGIVPYYPEEELTNNANSIYQCTQTGFACLVWVLEKGNMGYLKVTHDGNAKCPDNTKITWERGSCK